MHCKQYLFVLGPISWHLFQNKSGDLGACLLYIYFHLHHIFIYLLYIYFTHMILSLYFFYTHNIVFIFTLHTEHIFIYLLSFTHIILSLNLFQNMSGVLEIYLSICIQLFWELFQNRSHVSNKHTSHASCVGFGCSSLLSYGVAPVSKMD